MLCYMCVKRDTHKTLEWRFDLENRKMEVIRVQIRSTKTIRSLANKLDKSSKIMARDALSNPKMT